MDKDGIAAIDMEIITPDVGMTMGMAILMALWYAIQGQITTVLFFTNRKQPTHVPSFPHTHTQQHLTTYFIVILVTVMWNRMDGITHGSVTSPTKYITSLMMMHTMYLSPV